MNTCTTTSPSCHTMNLVLFADDFERVGILFVNLVRCVLTGARRVMRWSSWHEDRLCTISNTIESVRLMSGAKAPKEK